MPRHLIRALDELSALPERDASYLSDSDKRPVAPLRSVLWAYLDSARTWRRCGLSVDPPALGRVAELWKARVDLRELLWPLVGFQPCEALRRPFVRWIEQSPTEPPQADYVAWREAFVDVGNAVREEMKQRAARFRTPRLAVPACFVWGRYFGGGDEAWRQFALVLNWHERRDEQLHRWLGARVDCFFWRAGWRSEFEDAHPLLEDERAAIDEHLKAIGAEPLRGIAAGSNIEWRLARMHDLCASAAASARFAGDRFDEDDVELYARSIASAPGDIPEPPKQRRRGALILPERIRARALELRLTPKTSAREAAR